MDIERAGDAVASQTGHHSIIETVCVALLILVSKNEGWYPSISKTRAQKEQDHSIEETIFNKEGFNPLRFNITYSF